MVGLAAQRRKRNLAASVADLGMIVGLGYISRAEGDEGSGAVEASLRRQNYMPVGERDLHEILTEAIVAGKPQSEQSHDTISSGEIITGLAPYKKGASNEAPPVWVHESRFSHLVIHAASGEGASAGGNKGRQTLSSEIAGASDIEQVVEIVQRYFMAYLAATLKVSLPSVPPLYYELALTLRRKLSSLRARWVSTYPLSTSASIPSSLWRSDPGSPSRQARMCRCSRSWAVPQSSSVSTQHQPFSSYETYVTYTELR